MGDEDGSVHGIRKFDGTDFALWRMRIEDYLFVEKLHQPLGEKPEMMDEADWKLLDRHVLGVIRSTLSDNVAHNVVEEKTTAGMMKVLSDMYEKPLANKASIKMEENRGGVNAATGEDIVDAPLLSGDTAIESWILSTAACFHATAHRDIMENYVAGNHGKVYCLGGGSLDVVGVGDVNLKMSNGQTWKITGVRHVPKMVFNLISAGQLGDEGHTIAWANGSWKVMRGGMVVGRGQFSNSGEIRVTLMSSSPL